ncbi:MAG: ATP-dependent DNA ligase [Acidimicrobiales bacterium]
MQLAAVVAASEAVAATRARSRKIAILAELLRSLEATEAHTVAAMLTGVPRQGRIGVGWATLAGLDVGPAAAPTLSVADVDASVDRLATTSGAGSTAARRELLDDLFGRATAAEASFLFRLLTGELRQGALEGVLAGAIAAAAGVPVASVRRAAMLAGDLPAVAELALAGGEAGLASVGLTLLRPLQPMLAASSPDITSALDATGPASVEWKLDGARLQIHRAGDEVRLFTRNGNDVTTRLPGILELARSMPAQQFVLDGEVIGIDESERPGRFQDTMSSFGHRDASSGQHGSNAMNRAGLVVRFFDCLHVDGDDLLLQPLRQRLEVVDEIAGPYGIPRILTESVDEAAEFAEDALRRGHEGVMVKALDSLYDAGRRGGSWRKVKPVRTLDLVVLAAEWGHGRRQGWLSNLHLGARDPAGGFVMVGKTFKGLTDQLLQWQTEQFLARKERETRGTVYVRPELVVEIALDGVQSSTRYPGGVALRFARVRRYRDDKSPAEADTTDAVRALLP